MRVQPRRTLGNRIRPHRLGLWVPRAEGRGRLWNWPFVAALPLVAGCVELPQPAQQQLAEAERAYRAHNYREAATKLDDILRVYPEYKQSAEAYYLRAQTRVELKNKLGAAADSKKCLALSMDSALTARAHATAGQLSLEAGDEKSALQHFEAALPKLPETPPTDLARYRYAVCLQRLGEWHKARPQFALVFQRYPGSPLAEHAKVMFEWPWDYYVIQCGLFRDRKEADKLVRMLATAGLSPRVEPRPARRAGDDELIVCVGAYIKIDQAQDALRSVQKKLPKAFVAPITQ